MHALASPSSSARWLRCTGSLHLLALFPQPDIASVAADFGTQTHNLAKLLIGLPHEMKADLCSLYQDTNGYHPEILQQAQEYSEYIDSIGFPAEIQKHIEKQVVICSVDSDLFGTPDVVVYNHTAKELHIIDLKTGRERVSAIDNSQLMLYAQGALDTYEYAPESIVLHIYQNNKGAGNNIHTFTLTPQYLHEFISMAQNKLRLFRQGYYSFVAGKHCQYCPVRQHCSVFTQVAIDDISALQQAQQRQDTLETMDIQEAASLFAAYKGLAGFVQLLETRLLNTDTDALQTTPLEPRTRTTSGYTDDALGCLLDKLRADNNDELWNTVCPPTLISPSKLKKEYPEGYQHLVDSGFLIQKTTKYFTVNKDKL